MEDHNNEFCAQLNTPEECAQNFPKDLWAQINGPVAAMSEDELRQKTGKFESVFFTVLDMATQYKLNP